MVKVIAEIGCNHQGDINIAKELILQAKIAGAWAVKSQKRTVREYLTPEQYNKPYIGPNSFGETYGQHREVLELSVSEHYELKQYAKKLGIKYFVSVWDLTALKQMMEINLPIIKIPSALLTDNELLLEAKKFNRPIYISTGMSTTDEIDKAIKILEDSEIVIFHTTSCYPCKFQDVYLKNIQYLRERYKKPVGFSGHHLGIAIDIAAVMLGATIIERHFTLDRTMKGTDHAASLEPAGLHKLVRDLKALEKALDYWDRKSIIPCEEAARAKLRPITEAAAE